MSTSRAALRTPEEIAVLAGQQVPYLYLPVAASVFADRETRLRQLAAGHPMRDYLLFIATLTQAQHRVLNAPASLVLPDDQLLGEAADNIQPPLDLARWPLQPAWRDMLRAVLDAAAPAIGPGPAGDVLARVRSMEDSALDLQAQRLITGVMLGLDMAAAPFIAAGLQVFYTRTVIDTAAAHAGERDEPFGRTADMRGCPCCGSRPTSSVTRIGADQAGFRFLNCSLCSTQWHMVRIKCAHCESTKGITYQNLAPQDGAQPMAGASSPMSNGAVRAECCAECGHYLKLMSMDKDPFVEPVADDLASLPLDLLVGESGLIRHGVNLLLVLGDPGDP